MPALTANRLLKVVERYGQESTLVKPTFSSYNPATASVTASSTNSYTVKAYFAAYNLSELDNDNILLGDRKVLFPHVDVDGNTLPEPDTDDTISGVGDTVRIVSIRKIYSGESLVCYICQARE